MNAFDRGEFDVFMKRKNISKAINKQIIMLFSWMWRRRRYSNSENCTLPTSYVASLFTFTAIMAFSIHSSVKRFRASRCACTRRLEIHEIKKVTANEIVEFSSSFFFSRFFFRMNFWTHWLEIFKLSYLAVF